MTWKGTYEVEEWLSRSVVGALKKFGSVEDVNQKLDDRGFVFSSTFLGGHNIVWTFQSQCEKDGFINNRLLWKECLYEGDLMGEVLWIDKDTEFKQRLDAGKMLVLKRLRQASESKVTVKDGSHVFQVKLVECLTPVSKEWISKHLGLRPSFSNLNCIPDRVGSDKVWSVSRGFSNEEERRPDLDRDGGREALIVNSKDKKESRKGIRERSMRSPIFVRKEVCGGKVLLEKGKDQCCQKLTTTYKQKKGNGVIKIGTQRKSEYRSSSEESEYSSSGSESEDGPVVNGLWLKGECYN
ncbi:hypothetical protein LWI28_014766 [Acer negundo]|uniref:Uncharacterized protein n=1 Tax=Acer negundo TaxID=4023 RepID=A0AAD5IN08_ACENE|nr:hypothetical protein LWI28_014766 [Acer negundo]